MPGARFGGPKPDLTGVPTHYAIRGSVNGICGAVMATKRTQRDTHISCEACLRKRLAMLGVQYTDRALARMKASDEETVKLLRRALESAKRLARWRLGREEGTRGARLQSHPRPGSPTRR